ncbi:alpha/beta hydrolase [Leucobacter iarius]
MQQAMHQLRTGIAQVQASGDSVALSRLRAACRPVERQAQQIAQSRQKAGQALASYAGRVDELQQRARRLRVRRGEAEARRVSLMNTLAANPSTGPGMDALQSKVRSSLIGEETELGEIERQLAALDEERRAADARCASMLNGCASVLEGLPAGSSAEGFGALGQLPGVSFGARANTSAAVRKLTGVLLKSGATPEEVARAWAELIASEDFDADAFIEEHAFELASRNGLPFAVMNQAARTALEYALDPKYPDQLRKAFARMGFTDGERSLEEFKTDLEKIQEALVKAELKIGEGGTVQLVAFGRHDGVVTAGISMGDLDRASTVGLLVSGMNSDVRGIADAFDAFQKIRAGDVSTAMLTWVGYRSPNLAEEAFQDRADAGATALAGFLDGIAVQRNGNPIERFVTMGHSYGTNVLAEALKITNARVDAFVTLGSAGLKYGTTAKDLGVPEIHATHANGDNIAEAVGQRFHFRFIAEDGGGLYEARVDPRNLDGAKTFSSEKTPDGKRVTMHNLVNPINWKDTWLVGPALQWAADTFDGTAAADEVGYLNDKSSTVDGLGKIMRGHG